MIAFVVVQSIFKHFISQIDILNNNNNNGCTGVWGGGWYFCIGEKGYTVFNYNITTNCLTQRKRGNTQTCP